MTTADKSQDEKTALLDDPTERKDAAEVIFPAIERKLPAEEPEALISPAASEETVVTSQKEQDEETQRRATGKRKWILLLAGLILVAVSISIFFYLQNRPKPVPTPTSVDLPPQTSTTTTEMPETAFKISPEKQQLIGVQYGTVEYQTISKSLRSVGKVAFDETEISRINPKIEGWIENVYVDFTGKLVQKGQPLLTIYSPDLVQTQEEYLLAIKGRRQLGESPFPDAVNFSESLAKSARRRLELWDISEAQIRELEKRGTPTRTMTLYAPTSGFVTTRNAFPRQRVTPESELYAIADLSNVWVIADIYEFEAADIRLGQSATVTLSSYPGRKFNGKITYIYPQVESTTRTLKVRVELANKGFLLKPDMYADVILNMNYGRRLVVPQESVMDSGSEQLVYVSLKDGYFEPRKVQVGAKVDNKFVVLAGLTEGERVVTSGNFLVDSESKLKSAAGGMGMPGMDHGGSKSGEKSAPLQTQPQTQPSERKILYWYDPMNPAYRSDKPGKAPDGMDLVPKYADDK
ncbi:MAG TPA: efflux RND transporter periplasmic adaptor subunit [Pyrinomonadaceae bacterium]|nr:efflux RND transporter periplasmic adaptor subunit [Pyrinomonadaceae bacterium]